jgi:hypothetical protein
MAEKIVNSVITKKRDRLRIHKDTSDQIWWVISRVTADLFGERDLSDNLCFVVNN